MKLLAKITKDWFTGPDGQTYDPARSLWIIGILVFLALVGYQVYKDNGKFDMVNFGLAYGGLLAAGAAGVKIKESTEPKVKPDMMEITPPPTPAPKSLKS